MCCHVCDVECPYAWHGTPWCLSERQVIVLVVVGGVSPAEVAELDAVLNRAGPQDHTLELIVVGTAVATPSSVVTHVLSTQQTELGRAE